MLIDVYADIACPWCWIGEHRLLAALDALRARRPEVRVERRWRPFQLQPQLPAPGVPWAAFAHAKFGDAERMDAMFGHVAAAGAGDGCDFRFDRLAAAPNTADAHRLILLARDAASQAGDAPDDGTRELAMAEALFHAYFHEGRHVGERTVLLDIAAEQGLDRAWVAAQLAGDVHTPDVARSQHEATRLGIQGVPFVVLDDRLGVSGAQPVEVFAKALEAGLGSEPAVAGTL